VVLDLYQVKSYLKLLYPEGILIQMVDLRVFYEWVVRLLHHLQELLLFSHHLLALLKNRLLLLLCSQEQEEEQELEQELGMVLEQGLLVACLKL
jgi:hypothetical protein